MNLERRSFLKTLGTGALATTLPFGRSTLTSPAAEEQRLHQDYQTNNEGIEYYLLGNGLMLAGLQTSPREEIGTHCGLLVMSPQHFGRKISTYLYHPERGLQNSRCIVNEGGASYVAQPRLSHVSWTYPDGIPTVRIDWSAGGCEVSEELFSPPKDAVLVRTVRVKGGTNGAKGVSIVLLLYPNQMYFDEYDVDRVRGTLTASGYKTLRLFASKVPVAGDRHLAVSVGDLSPGEEQSTMFFLTLDTTREEVERKGVKRMTEEARSFWNTVTRIRTGDGGLDHLFRTSVSGLRALVAQSGKVDGSLWQYNFEWVRDQSLVATGAVMAGLDDVAEPILRRILTRSVDDEGRTIDASRHRSAENIELDQNGVLLYALWTHWNWTGRTDLIKEHWKKISAVADYVLRPEFRDPESGLLKNSREFWERDRGFGVKEGFENAYQFWNIVGLEKAAAMASLLKQPARQQKWLEASRTMKNSYLHHPKLSLVEDGRFIKRRMPNGQVQRTFEPPNRATMPPGMPMNVEEVSYCDPDTSSALPIAYGVVEPTNPISLKTLESLEVLWNQRWTNGGYARYHVTSEPDSPGPWPFASLFVARAYFEAGNDEKVWRVLRWLQNVQGGKAGAWFELYGDRPVPPLPPVGIIPWTWAELSMFFMHHLFGVRPEPDVLILRPRLLAGLSTMDTQTRIRGKSLRLSVTKSDKEPFAVVNGKRQELKDGALRLPLPKNEVKVEINL